MKKNDKTLGGKKKSEDLEGYAKSFTGSYIKQTNPLTGQKRSHQARSGGKRKKA